MVNTDRNTATAGTLCARDSSLWTGRRREDFSPARVGPVPYGGGVVRIGSMETPSAISGAGDAAVEAFLKDVLRSGLLDRDRLQAAVWEVPRERRTDTQALADHLVRSGRLSRFQARRILKGRWRGLILGPFQLLAPIGRGGMGTVFLARDGRNTELVALKVLPRDRAERRQRARFRREMKLSRRLDHPHVAATYATGKIEGVYFIAMEYIPGKSLQRLVQAEGPLNVPRAARLMSEVAAGLEHAHLQGLIHRDLKPSNIMVTPHDHAKILDLGLAILEGEDLEDFRVVGGKGYIVGTMDYIAPEQTANSATVDRRADIYSLGCTLYYAVTGRPPFPGGTTKEKIQRQRREEPESLLDLKPTIPVAFAVLIRQLMAKDPADRPASATDVIRKLRRWSGDAVLPLDRKDDPEYSSAVYALQEELGVDANVIESATPPVESSIETETNPESEAAADDYVADVPGSEAFAGMALWLAWPQSVRIGVGVAAAVLLMGIGAIFMLLLTHH
jgi:eukaryotic-like serine/threonine-protein kinase